MSLALSRMTPTEREALKRLAPTWEPKVRPSPSGIALVFAAVLLVALVLTQPLTRPLWSVLLLIDVSTIGLRKGGRP